MMKNRTKYSARLHALARDCGVSVTRVAEVERRLAALPMETFLAHLFAPGEVVYDAGTDLWIARNKRHRGPGFGFIAIRRDKSYFTGVIPAESLQ
jgi:hypothetical protein